MANLIHISGTEFARTDLRYLKSTTAQASTSPLLSHIYSLKLFWASKSFFQSSLPLPGMGS